LPVVDSSPESLDRAAALLERGAVVAFPTETVYGLGASAFDARAVARIFEIKARPSFDPLIVHVCEGAMLERVALRVSPLAQRLIDAFWPGPLTLVLPKTDAVPHVVTSGL
jgi:L-threonylcarbamoyladenylate synthase